jgi:hypothetical protein
MAPCGQYLQRRLEMSLIVFRSRITVADLRGIGTVQVLLSLLVISSMLPTDVRHTRLKTRSGLAGETHSIERGKVCFRSF